MPLYRPLAGDDKMEILNVAPALALSMFPRSHSTIAAAFCCRAVPRCNASPQNSNAQRRVWTSQP